MLLDRMINLLTRGCVVPVVKYIQKCCQKGDTDMSLIRYFVTEVSTHFFFSTFFFFFILVDCLHNAMFVILTGIGNDYTSIFFGICATIFTNGRK